MNIDTNAPHGSKRTAAWVTGSMAVFATVLMIVVGYPLGARGPISLGVLSIIAISVLVSIFMIGAEVFRRYSSTADNYEATASGPMIIALEMVIIAAIITLFFLLRYG